MYILLNRGYLYPSLMQNHLNAESQFKCLPVIGNYPRRTPIPLIHSNLHILSIRDFIYHLTERFYNGCLNHPNPLISSTGNYSLSDLRYQYKKYIHKRPNTFSSNVHLP